MEASGHLFGHAELVVIPSSEIITSRLCLCMYLYTYVVQPLERSWFSRHPRSPSLPGHVADLGSAVGLKAGFGDHDGWWW